MYCNNCGKKIPKESKFCQHCGSQVILSEDKKQDKKTPATKEEATDKSNVDMLWDKFVEVYDAKDEDRRKFNSLSSIHIWELLDRLAVNAFETFLQANKEDFNKQPYKTIEALKTVYSWSVIGGYRLWLAEALLDDKEELNKFKSFSLDDFVEAWKKYDFDKAFKAITENMGIAITRYNEFRFNSFMEAAPEAKELSNEAAEKLKSSLLYQVVSGYHAGTIENSFRK